LRLELGPSRWLAGALMAIGILGAGGLFLSNLSALTALLLAPIVLAWGALLARRELRASPTRIVFRDDGRVEVAGEPADDVLLDWQGPLTRIHWQRAGERRCLVLWPDVLPAALRRELRLWRLAHRADASTRPVAP
jgi:hypothetical protein